MLPAVLEFSFYAGVAFMFYIFFCAPLVNKKLLPRAVKDESSEDIELSGVVITGERDD